jgi:DNA-binding SARP family transcriptional activator/TolB-like protein
MSAQDTVSRGSKIVPSLPPGAKTIEILLLGPFQIRLDGKEVALPRKACALLAHLCVNKGRRISRDRLATLLWARSGTQQARQSLRQCLSMLRDAFGADAVLPVDVERDAVSLTPSPMLSCDIDAFHAALETDDLGRIRTALSLWRGEFLLDMVIPIEPFEEWLLIEKEGFSQLYSNLLLRFGRLALRQGMIDEALATARQAVQHDPLREESHQLLMDALILQGQRGAAIQQYEALARLLSEELGIQPDESSAELLRRARNPGSVPAKPAIPSLPAAAPVLPHPKKPSIAVIPFCNLTGDPALDLLSQALVEDLTGALGREKWLFVISNTSASAFANPNADIREVGRQLGVAYVLRGSLRRQQDSMSIVVMLSDATTGEFLASHKVEGGADKLFQMVDRLTSLVGARLAPELRLLEVERAARKPMTSLSAFEYYLRALPLFRNELAGNLEALELLNRALQLDPSFAAAHALMARCYQFQKMWGWMAPDDPGFERGLQSAYRAAELGQNDAEALWMASHAINFLSSDTDCAAELIERALDLNPSSANCWTTSCSVQTMLGNAELAITHFQSSQRLNPLDRSHHLHWNIVGLAQFALGAVDEANEAADRALRINPVYPQALRLKISALGQLDQPDAAAPFIDRLLGVHPGFSCRWLRDFWAKPMHRVPSLYESFIEGTVKAGAPQG